MERIIIAPSKILEGGTIYCKARVRSVSDLSGSITGNKFCLDIGENNRWKEGGFLKICIGIDHLVI